MGVAAISPTDGWAVGDYYNGRVDRTLVERWDGKDWKTQTSPDPASGRNDILNGVAASSAKNAWAVGYYGPSGNDRTLVEHWDGKAWNAQTSPNPVGGNDNVLVRVTATSAKNAWAVGYSYHGTTARTLIERWNGKAWQVQKSPHPGDPSNASFLYGASATSPTNAWAVGDYFNGTTYQTLIEHWNGKAWQVQKSRNPGGSSNSMLTAVAATSATNAWAVGEYYIGTAVRTIIERWNGKVWKAQPTPKLSIRFLANVAATSGTSAWAVGFHNAGSGNRTLILHWNGKAWRTESSPDRGSSTNELLGVSATSPGAAWAVGYYRRRTAEQTLVEHQFIR